MSIAGTRDIGAQVAIRRAVANTSLTAGGAGDNTAVNGVIFDRAALGWPQSAAFLVAWLTTLAASQTLTVGWAVQHGDQANLSDATTLFSGSSVVATGAGTGVTGDLEINVSLRGARRYVRLVPTPDLSASGTDTAQIFGAVAFGGAERLPA